MRGIWGNVRTSVMLIFYVKKEGRGESEMIISGDHHYIDE